MANTSRPTPDPTILTTEQLERAIGNLTVLMEAKIDGLEDVLTEKFISINDTLKLIDRQRIEQKSDTEKAVQAALSAAKEAVKEQTVASDKAITTNQNATAEQLKQMSATFTTAFNGQTLAINALTTRVERIENFKQGTSEGVSKTWAVVIACITIVVALFGSGFLAK